MNNYTKFEVGKPLGGVKGREDGCVFDLTDSGAILYVYYNSPTSEEVRNYSDESPLEVRYVVLEGEIYLLFKFGSEEWLDTPYNPHLSKELTKLNLIQNDSEGLSLMIVLADTATGVVKVIRLVGLSNNFSRSFIGAVLDRLKKPFSQSAYDQSITRTYAAYSTRRMLNFAISRSRTGY